MPCDLCGASCHGDFCAGCEQIRANEKMGLPSDFIDEEEADREREWELQQRGLGDHDAEGQATLSGDIVKEGGQNP